MAVAYRSGMAVADKASIIAKAGPIRMPGPGDFPDSTPTMRMRMHDLERTHGPGPCRNLILETMPCAAQEASMLTIRDLSKTYANGVRALRGVSLDIPNGMFGLLGPNGAGKSSLMRTIATLQDPDTGTIKLDEMTCSPTSRPPAACSAICRRSSAYIRRSRRRQCWNTSPCSKASP
jgi:ABC-type multidrug transport system, ATPase component